MIISDFPLLLLFPQSCCFQSGVLDLLQQPHCIALLILHHLLSIWPPAIHPLYPSFHISPSFHPGTQSMYSCVVMCMPCTTQVLSWYNVPFWHPRTPWICSLEFPRVQLHHHPQEHRKTLVSLGWHSPTGMWGSWMSLRDTRRGLWQMWLMFHTSVQQRWHAV